MRISLSEGLIYLGWFLFSIALFCPAMGDCSGWMCFIATLCCFPIWLFWPAMVFGLTNILWLFSSLVYCCEAGVERKAYGVFLMLASCATLATVLGMLEGARIGCYFWLGALFATASGFLLSSPFVHEVPS